MPGFDQARLKRISAWMQSYVTDRKYPGASVLITQRGQEVFFDRCGVRDVSGGKPFERDTVARIYSMTKPITSVALMMLVEEGRIYLDAPLSSVLPEFSECHALIPGAERIDQVEYCAPPTLHQCVTHTAGFTYPFNPGVLPAAMEERDLLFKPNQGRLADRVAELAQLPLAFQPGQRWEYSVGIDVIGRVVEAISGQSLDAFFAERIFGPLGMTETAFSVPEAARPRFAHLYTPLAGDAMDLNAAEKGGDTLREVDDATASPFLDATCYSGGGGLVGTIDDYLRFAEMLRQGGMLAGEKLLSRHSVAFMRRNHLQGDIASMGPQSFAEQPMEGMGFGIGGAVVLDPGRARCPGSIGDFSWGGMASTFFWIDPVHDLSVLFFTQLSPSSSYPSRSQLKALVHGALE